MQILAGPHALQILTAWHNNSVALVAILQVVGLHLFQLRFAKPILRDISIGMHNITCDTRIAKI